MSRRSTLAASLAWLALTAAVPAAAIVDYDAGQRTILGVQLLRDLEDPTAYYYLPPFPRLASRDDGSLELLCLKFVDSAGGTSGGLFHALVEFSLPADAVTRLEAALRRDVPGARIVGPVPLLQAGTDGENGLGSFEVVSAVLSDREEGGFTRSVVTSGRAPLAPGSKAVVAARLDQQGASLLWESLSGSTSDVSIALHAYYEAAVKGYNAMVRAEMSTIYEHSSLVFNRQQGYTKRQIRDVVDELKRDGKLEIEVFDRTATTGIDAGDLEAVLQIVTDKLTELMFDHTAGWAADPEREAAVESGQLLGRQERSWLARTFGSRDDTPYYTDDQYVLKDRKDVRQNTFVLNLAKRGTIKVPVDTAGNLGGVYRAFGEDPRYFRVVDLGDDPSYQTRDVHFQVDGEFIDAFRDTLNFVAVNVRRVAPDRPAFTRELHFTSEGVKGGGTLQTVVLSRLGDPGDAWTEYEYQVRWSLRGESTLSVPSQPNGWIRTRDAVVALTPPFERTVVEIDADRAGFESKQVASVVVELFSQLAGRPRLERKAVLGRADAEPTALAAVYHDRDTPLAVRLIWNTARGSVPGPLTELDGTYLYLVPPADLAVPEDVP
jgi:hypothetical protein